MQLNIFWSRPHFGDVVRAAGHDIGRDMRLKLFWSRSSSGDAPSAASHDIGTRNAIDHFTYYCLGSQGGKLWVVMRLLGPIAGRKVCRNTAEITEKDWSPVLNRRLPVSTFSPNHWSWRCHLLSPHWAEIDRFASGAERAREIKEKKQLAIADAGAAAAAAQSEGETSSQRACGSRKADWGTAADRGTQETRGRNGASTCLLECEYASSKLALSHTLFWERERKRRLAEAFISGLSSSGKLSGKRWVLS